MYAGPVANRVEIHKGVTFSHTLQWVRADDTAYALIGTAVSATLKDSGNSADDGTDLNAAYFDKANGEITISLTAAETADLSPGDYIADFLEDITATPGENVERLGVLPFRVYSQTTSIL